MDLPIIDAHVHCGKECRTDPRNGRPQPQAFEDYLSWARGAGIAGAVMFSPVPEVYDRLNPDFEDDPSWQLRRRDSSKYVLSLARDGFEVFPFFFIWNDFAIDQLSPRHLGIKWHRHADEPHYHYDDPRCAAATGCHPLSPVKRLSAKRVGKHPAGRGPESYGHRRNDASWLSFDAAAVLKRAGKHGDLFAPVLTLKQTLPRLELF